MLAEEIPASIVFFDLLVRGRSRSARRCRFAERRAALEALLARRDAAAPPHAGDARPRDRRRLVPALRGRRPRRRHGQAGRRHLRAEQARHAQGEARARLRLRRRRLPLAQERRGRPRSARCCSASTTTRAACSTSASARASPTRSGASSSSSSRPIAQTRSTIIPWKEWAEADSRGRAGAAPARARQSRWSQGKDLSWEPLRPELVVEVAYDHMQGTRFRHTAQFRRWRPDKQPARLHLRAARGRPAARAGRRSSTKAGSQSSRLDRERCSQTLAPVSCSARCVLARAIPASDRRPDRASPAAGGSLRARCAG